MTDPVGYENIKELSQLSAGRVPIALPQSWVYSADIGSAIAPAAVDGVDTTDVLKAHVGVRLSRTPSKYRGLLRIDAHSDANPYGVEFFGGAGLISGATAGSIAAIIVNVLADFAANFTIGTAALYGDTIDIIEWIIDDKNRIPPYYPPDDFIGAGTLVDSILSDVAGLAANQSSIVEASHARWRVWGIATGDTAYQLRDELDEVVSMAPGGQISICVAGWDRTFVEIISADGYSIGWVAPSYLEADEETTQQTADTAWTDAYTALPLFVVGEQGRALPESRPSKVTHGSSAPEIGRQAMTTVGVAATVVMPANTSRRSYLLRNSGTSDVWLKWRPSLSLSNHDPAIGDGFQLKAGEIKTGVGAGAPGNELIGLADGINVDVWSEET